MSLSDIKEVSELSINLYKQAKREPGLDFEFQNETLKPYWNVLDNIVPAINFVKKKIQHIHVCSVEKIYLKLKKKPKYFFLANIKYNNIKTYITHQKMLNVISK